MKILLITFFPSMKPDRQSSTFKYNIETKDMTENIMLSGLVAHLRA